MLTYSPAQARNEIEKLVETFARNESALQYAPEAQIENDFIRPLFRFLNWNVDNIGLSRAQWEFVLQRTERRKRPDYELWLDGRRVLIMDAKKVKYEMHDPRWLNQVYAYAYSTQNDAPARKTDFAILTDFQEFIVLDCTLLAGTPEAVHNFRVVDWQYPDYVARFDELWDLFERSNVLRAHQTRDAGLWARYLSPKKVKANRVPPDKAFLSALDDVKTGWRVRLAKDMKKNNPALGGEVLTAAVQLWIDRLIFIKVLSDREIEDDYLAQMAERVERDGLAENNFGWFAATRSIFQKLNQIYNGSIFAPRPELEAVNVSNKIVREIIGELLPENSPYNFDSLPVEILGTIYERFLGRVVHATEKQVRIEDKPEVRKAGGVFYTPQYIVHYIVENTVGKLLQECTTPADVAQLKILDPACGSGSFLLGAYDALIRWHENYYQTTDDGQPTTKQGARSAVRRPSSADAYYLDADGRVRLTAKLKRQILVNNLFGVDIDPQAVEVTRLSLSLKALEDTRRAELYQEVDLFHQRVLPDLTDNIKCGNSLIGTDFIFTDADELKRVKPFDWRAEFPFILDRRDGSPKTRHVSDGFDAVIGNPPWGADFSSFDLSYFRNSYSVAKGLTIDSYALFIERSIQVLRDGGRLGFITPDTFLRKSDHLPTRELLLKQTNVLQLVEAGPLFSQVRDTWCLVFTSEKSNLSLHHQINQKKINRFVVSPEERLQRFTDGKWDVDANVAQAIWLNRPQLVIGYLSSQEEQSLIRKIESHPNLGQLIQRFRISRGEEGSKFALKENPHGNYAIVIPENIERYHVANGIKISSAGLTQTKVANLYNHPKIWIIRIQKMRWKQRVVCGFDGRNNSAGMKTLQVIISTTDNQAELKYLQAILASKLTNFWCVNYLADDMNQTYLEKLPIRVIDFSNPADVARHDQMVTLVERMLLLHQQRAAAQTETDQQLFQRQIDATDKQIDALVYELYGLTNAEIKIVEGTN